MKDVNATNMAMAMLNIAENHSFELATTILKKYSDSKELDLYSVMIESTDDYFENMSPYNFIHELADIGMVLYDNDLITRYTIRVTEESIMVRYTF